ncbi:MAG: hypothetical protein ACRD2A_16415, partial [Vicinamibacterales bacterium]
MRIFIATIGVALSFSMSDSVAAQPQTDRARARIPYGIGVEHMRSEKWEEAAKAFQQAVDIDSQFDLAFYMLGRADMALTRYVAASLAFRRCKEIYLAQAGRRFASAQEAQRYR